MLPCHICKCVKPNIQLPLKYITKENFLHFLTCDKDSFWTIVSFPTLILRVDKASLSSPTLQPINFATVVRPEHEKCKLQCNNLFTS
jgi:hypothetical protein